MLTHPSTMSAFQRRIALAAALVSVLGCQGCTSLLVAQQVDRQPRYARPDASRTVQGSYLGLARADDRWHYAFRFPDFVWTGPRVRRESVVLVPAEPGPGRAIVVGGDAARVREVLLRTLGNAPALYDPAQGPGAAHGGGRPATAQVRPLGTGQSPPLRPGTAEVSAEYPAVLEFRVGTGGGVEGVRVGWETRDGLEWAGPYEVVDRVKRPTWGERAARPLTSLGYLVSVPIDIVTLPAQVAAGLLLLVAAGAG